MNRHTPGRLPWILMALLLLLSLPAHAGEGFGRMIKKTANLTRVRPPEVQILGKRIAIRVSNKDSRNAGIAQRLQTQLESELIGNDSGLTLESERPESVLDVTILHGDYSESWEPRQMQHQVAAEYDAKGRVTKWRTEEITVQFKIVHYAFNAAYKLDDVRAHRSLAADTIASNFKQDFEGGHDAPEPVTLEDGALNLVAGVLKRKLTKTKETVGVLLPRGRLESAAAFADAGLWSKYLESLDRMPAFTVATDEAYRQYALGVANEALGYGAESTEQTLKYLEQAATHYNNAVDGNPTEGYFTKPYESILSRGKTAEAPIKRVQEALVQYQKQQDFAAVAAAAAGGSSSATGGKGAGFTASEPSLNNDAVIEMLSAGLPEDVIITSVDAAKHRTLDVSPKGLIQLSQAKASKKLIQHLQATAHRDGSSSASQTAAKKQ